MTKIQQNISFDLIEIKKRSKNDPKFYAYAPIRPKITIVTTQNGD